MKLPTVVAIGFVACSSQAYQVTTTTTTRRQAMQSAVTTTAAATLAGLVSMMPMTANAIDACPPKSQNCVRTTWTPPPGTSKPDVVKTIESVFAAYPQDGQLKVDQGGWSWADNSLAKSGTGRAEFKSGNGNFAKFFNGGQPFVDDVNVEISDSGTVEVRSASRIGESDMGVNPKRLQFLAGKLKEQGWSVAEKPTY